jgi:hypothetical protein
MSKVRVPETLPSSPTPTADAVSQNPIPSSLRTERTRREAAVGARYALPDRSPLCHVDALAKLVGATVQFDHLVASGELDIHLVASGELDIVTFGHLKET